MSQDAPKGNRTIIVERISYAVFSIEGGRRLKTWAKVGTKLKPITATTEARLRKKLHKISVDLLNGQVEAAEMDAGDNRAFLAMREIARRRGVSPEAAMREYDAAKEILGNTSMLEAARFYQLHAGTIGGARTVQEVIDELKPKLLKLSAVYREIFEYDLQRLARAIGAKPIAQVSTAELESFVDTTGRIVQGKVRPASDFRRKQVRGHVVALFNFARRRGCLPRRLDHAAHDLERIATFTTARPVWDPEHLRRGLELIWTHERAWLPWTAISSLANVRSMGTRRLQWENVHWLDALLELEAKISKVKTRVTVKISDTLMSWLEPWRGKTGPVCPPDDDLGEFTARLRKKHGLPYYPNVLRKSYITYLLAETDDEEMVARVANTSVKKLRANYRQIRTFAGRLVTKELATAWFSTARIMALNEHQLELGA